MSDLHVLHIPTWYPTLAVPTGGIFFKQQILALRAAGVRVGVVFPDFRRIRTASLHTIQNNRFHETVTDEDGVPSYRYHGWNFFPAFSMLGGQVWSRSAVRLVRRYVAQHGMPDLVHAHCALWAGAASVVWGQCEHVPFVLTE